MTNHMEDTTQTTSEATGTAAVEPPGGTPPQATPPNTPYDEEDFALEPHIVRGLD